MCYGIRYGAACVSFIVPHAHKDSATDRVQFKGTIQQKPRAVHMYAIKGEMCYGIRYGATCVSFIVPHAHKDSVTDRVQFN